MSNQQPIRQPTPWPNPKTCKHLAAKITNSGSFCWDCGAEIWRIGGGGPWYLGRSKRMHRTERLPDGK